MACRRSFSVLVMVLWVLFASGCDESLPPRSDPSHILVASLRPPQQIIEMDNGIPIVTAGSFNASVKNVYNDVLQKEAKLQATITVWMAKSPEVHRTIRVPPLLAHPTLDRNLLTLVPQDSARFFVVWDQRTDTGVPFWNFVRLTLVRSPHGVYFDSDPIEFVAQASIQIFENVQPRTSPPIHYTCSYRLWGETDGNN